MAHVRPDAAHHSARLHAYFATERRAFVGQRGQQPQRDHDVTEVERRRHHVNLHVVRTRRRELVRLHLQPGDLARVVEGEPVRRLRAGRHPRVALADADQPRRPQAPPPDRQLAVTQVAAGEPGQRLQIAGIAQVDEAEIDHGLFTDLDGHASDRPPQCASGAGPARRGRTCASPRSGGTGRLRLRHPERKSAPWTNAMPDATPPPLAGRVVPGPSPHRKSTACTPAACGQCGQRRANAAGGQASRVRRPAAAGLRAASSHGHPVGSASASRLAQLPSAGPASSRGTGGLVHKACGACSRVARCPERSVIQPAPSQPEFGSHSPPAPGSVAAPAAGAPRSWQHQRQAAGHRQPPQPAPTPPARTLPASPVQAAGARRPPDAAGRNAQLAPDHVHRVPDPGHAKRSAASREVEGIVVDAHACSSGESPTQPVLGLGVPDA